MIHHEFQDQTPVGIDSLRGNDTAQISAYTVLIILGSLSAGDHDPQLSVHIVVLDHDIGTRKPVLDRDPDILRIIAGAV